MTDTMAMDGQGLTTEEAARRLAAHGPNVVRETVARSALALLGGQVTDFMILVLLAAAVVAGVMGDLGDAVAIVAIVVLNATIGFWQEYRAEHAIAALRAMAAPTATVLRDGRSVEIPASQVVPGDLVVIEAGRIVPVDLRLLQVADLRVDEATLTGESVPVGKLAEPMTGAACGVEPGHTWRTRARP